MLLLTRPASSEGSCFAEVTTLGKIDTVWAIGWLAANTKLTSVVLHKCQSTNPETVKQLMCYKLHSSPLLRIPDECIEKSVMALTCTSRGEETGHRLDSIPEEVLQQMSNDGKFPWGLLGVYGLRYPEGQDVADGILHRPTGHWENLGDETITRQHQLKDNWSDVGCVAKRGHSTTKLCEFFKKNRGPWAVRQLVGSSEPFQTLMRGSINRLNQVQETSAKLGEVVEDHASFKKMAQDKRKKAMERAHEGLAKRAKASAEKRLVPAVSAICSATY